MAQQRTQITPSAWWLPDDTEESVVGAEWHQFAISSLVNGLREDAARAHPTWHVGNQLTLIGPHPSGRRLWRPKPDALIHLSAGAALRDDLDTRTEGLPALLIEVLSPSTQAYDLSLRGMESGAPGKAWGYLEWWGVAEYLTFDPLEEYVPGQVRAWRRAGDRTVAWEAEPSGHYASALGVSFAAEGPYLRVYDGQGQPLPFDSERIAWLVQRDQELIEERAERQQMAHRLVEEERVRHQVELQLVEEERVRQQMANRLRELEEELHRLRGENQNP